MDNKQKYIKMYSIILGFCILLFAYFIIFQKDCLSKICVDNRYTDNAIHEKKDVISTYVYRKKGNDVTDKDLLSTQEKISLKECIDEKDQIIKSLTIERDRIKEKYDNQKELLSENIDILLKAKELFDMEEYQDALIIIDDIDKELLLSKSEDIYNNIKNESLKSLGRQTYQQGYEAYINQDFETAINLFQQAYNYDKKQSFSYNALYYLGYSFFKNEQYDDALATFKKLLDEYPNTPSRNDVERILSMDIWN